MAVERIDPRIGMPSTTTPNTSGTPASGASSTRRPRTCAMRYSRLRIGLATRRLSSLRIRPCTIEKPIPHMLVPMMLRPTMPGINQST